MPHFLDDGEDLRKIELNIHNEVIKLHDFINRLKNENEKEMNYLKEVIYEMAADNFSPSECSKIICEIKDCKYWLRGYCIWMYPCDEEKLIK